MPDCYLTSNCSVEMISNDLYTKFVLPLDQRLADTFGSFGIHHCGKTMEHVAQGYSKVKGLTFAEVGAGPGLCPIRIPDTASERPVLRCQPEAREQGRNRGQRPYPVYQR